MKKIRKNRRDRREKNNLQVYRNPDFKPNEPERVIAMLKKTYPDAPFFKEFCAGCHEQKAIQMISAWIGHDEAKALYTLCPSCAQTIQYGTLAGVALLNRKIEKNLKAWLRVNLASNRKQLPILTTMCREGANEKGSKGRQQSSHHRRGA